MLILILVIAVSVLSGCGKNDIDTQLASTGSPEKKPSPTPRPKQDTKYAAIDGGYDKDPEAIPAETAKTPEATATAAPEPVEEIISIATPTPITEKQSDFSVIYGGTRYSYRSLSHADVDDELCNLVLEYVTEFPLSKEILPLAINVHYEDKYSVEEITEAIEKLKLDFNEVALLFATDELENGAHSAKDLEANMETLKFQNTEIAFTVDTLATYDFDLEAKELADSLLAESYVSESAIREELEKGLYTKDNINYVMKGLKGTAWEDICYTQMKKWVNEYGWTVSEAESLMREKGWEDKYLKNAKQKMIGEKE